MEAQLHGARGRLGQLPHGVDGRARGGIEVAAVVDLIRDVGTELSEEGCRPPVQHRHVDTIQGMAQQGHAGRLINSSGLGPQDPILQGLAEANAIATRDLVGQLYGFQGAHRLAVDGSTSALHELHGDLLLLVGRILGPYAHHWIHNGDRGLHRLEVLCLVAQTANVGIRGVSLGCLAHDLVVDAMLLQKAQHLRSPGELLQQHRVAPGRIDFEGRVHDVDVAFKSDLVVSSTCGAVGQHGAAVLLHGFQQTSGCDISTNPGGLPVATIVHGLGSHCLKGALRDFLLEVHHDGVHATGSHFFDHIIHVVFIGLSDVGREALHLDTGQAQAQRHGLGVQAAADADAHHVAVLHVFLQDG
mmetsp:Transcript_58274/g.71250  ORF Transcript_58274/g.71250 Transcript_58274/m.71250 type:complete len:358 (-) Transcript_58274:47-1120(-)